MRIAPPAVNHHSVAASFVVLLFTVLGHAWQAVCQPWQGMSSSLQNKRTTHSAWSYYTLHSSVHEPAVSQRAGSALSQPCCFNCGQFDWRPEGGATVSFCPQHPCCSSLHGEQCNWASQRCCSLRTTRYFFGLITSV